MAQKFLFFLLFYFQWIGFAQSGFIFQGQVNSDFIGSTAYLNKVDDLNQKDRFFTENIFRETTIDSSGYFSFNGDFLPKKNGIYKIYIDNCSKTISHTNHILDRCQNHVSILFIANNSSQLSFPLNDLNQEFCEIDAITLHPSFIQKIDSFQNHILQSLILAKNDRQRQLIYKQSLFKLQDFSQNLNEPLAELYAFYIYSNSESFSRSYFLEDIKTSNYYSDLENKLKKQYPNTGYYQQYKKDLALFKPKNSTINSSKNLFYVIGLLIISLSFNFYFLYRNKKLKLNSISNKQKVNYKTKLTKQEQNVFELMHSGLTNKAIAQSLFVSLSTIKTHINNIYSKLEITSRNEVSSFFDED